jgi:integral membrane protein (TIGR01906 family)
MMATTTSRLLSGLVTLLLPVAFILTAVRILLTPAYVLLEYNTPGFPPDQFGFTKEDRFYWANLALDYLLNDKGIEFLADLRFPPNQQTPPASCQFMDDCTRLYNDRELKHMLDVKHVVQAALNVWLFSLIALVGLGFWAKFGGWWKQYRRGLGRGGWLTVGLLVGILLFVLFAFGLIFVAFHNVFFESGTWTFLYSDTLIRLFPERFWRDTFLAVGLLAGGAGLAFGLIFKQRD